MFGSAARLAFAIGSIGVGLIPWIRGSVSLGQVALIVPIALLAGMALGSALRKFTLKAGAFWLFSIVMLMLFVTLMVPTAVLSARVSVSAVWVYIWLYFSGLFAATLLSQRGNEERD